MIPLYRPDDSTRNKVLMGTLALNDPADSGLSTYELNAVIPTAAVDASVDSGPNDNGAIVTPAKRVYYVVKLDGTIRATTPADLNDRKAAIAAATDPALLSRKNPLTNGLVAIDFDYPTADSTNFPAGYIPSRLMGRGRTPTLPMDSIYQGLSAYFSIDLLVPDPRRVSQALQSRVGAGTASNLGNDGADAVLSIAMTGAGSATYTITRTGAITGAKVLVLNLSGRANGQTVIVTMSQGTITVSSVEHDEIFVSGPFWDLDPGANTIAIANATNATTTIQWRHSWVA